MVTMKIPGSFGHSYTLTGKVNGIFMVTMTIAFLCGSQLLVSPI